MSVDLAKGKISISKSETKTAILVNEGNFIQVPSFEEDPFARVFISKHGNMNYTWIGLTQETCMAIEPPFYVYSKLPCTIGLMEV